MARTMEEPIRLNEQTALLADDHRWPAVYDLLAAADRAALLHNEVLAYRFCEALYFTARFTELRQFATDYEAASRQALDMLGVMRAINFAGIAAFECGELAAASDRFRALMDVALAERDGDMQAHAANNLGTLASLKGDHDQALSHYTRCRQAYERSGNARGVAQTVYNEGLTYADLRLVNAAMARFEQAIAIASRLDLEPLVVMARTARAELEVTLGDATLGRALANHAVSAARTLADAVSEAEALRVRALANAESFEDAESDLTTALALAPDHPLLQAKIERDRGRIHLRGAQCAAGQAFLASAAERFAALGASGEATVLRQELAALVQGPPECHRPNAAS